VPHASVTIGSIEVTPLCDGWAALPLEEELPGRAVDWEAERARHPWAFPPDEGPSWAWHVHAFLVPHPDGPVLVDSGIGHLGRPPFDVTGRIGEELGAAGVAPTDVAHVVLTHLHADHSGGACRPDGSSPRFPNARYHVHPEDWRFFEVHRTPEDFTGRFVMRSIEEAGMLDLDPSDHEIVPGIEVRHAPGHTPGHRVVLLVDRDESLLLTGDLLHVPPQVVHPEWTSPHDEDPELGASERSRHLEAARAEGWTVGVSHFGQPFGRVGPGGWAPA
jgi:glyoxylase-like metal-dependent hydrolase (beta-lactamase superfamily II)